MLSGRAWLPALGLGAVALSLAAGSAVGAKPHHPAKTEKAAEPDPRAAPPAKPDEAADGDHPAGAEKTLPDKPAAGPPDKSDGATAGGNKGMTPDQKKKWCKAHPENCD